MYIKSYSNATSSFINVLSKCYLCGEDFNIFVCVMMIFVSLDLEYMHRHIISWITLI